MYRTGILVAATLFSAAAAAAYNPAHIYNEVRVVNNSEATVSSVTVVHRPSGRSYSCDEIKPLQVCNNYFGKRRFDAGSFEVTWTYDGGAAQSETFDAAVPPFFVTGIAMQAIVDIDPAGNASFHNDQYSPN
ncbi:MAG: hypothetical protein QNJ85_19010 [Gammaproteobacteria bacterium]|nr:hypothetical protein [Gammaproteobacteria bacterium]